MKPEAALEQELLELGVARGDFCIGEIRERALSILPQDQRWLLVTEERGLRVFEKSFDDFNEMRLFILKMFSKEYYGGKRFTH